MTRDWKRLGMPMTLDEAAEAAKAALDRAAQSLAEAAAWLQLGIAVRRWFVSGAATPFGPALRERPLFRDPRFLVLAEDDDPPEWAEHPEIGRGE